MDFSLGANETEWRDRVRAFIDEHVRPRTGDYDAQQREGDRWKVLPVIEDLKGKARDEGLWNLFMPPSHGATPVDDSFDFDGPGLNNLQYAFCAEEMGRIMWSSEVFNCSAPDTGNMEVLNRYGTREQNPTSLRPTRPTSSAGSKCAATSMSSTVANGGRAGQAIPAARLRC
jgi:acyl-CoA dehydrogenase